MMRRRSLLLIPVFLLGGCYHAVVNTGLNSAATPKVVQNDWAPGWIAGLIPPKPMDTKDACPRGVAKVETLHSVPNLLVQILTASIFSPMTIKVTCAQ